MLDFAATDTIQYLCRQVLSWLLDFRGLQEVCRLVLSFVAGKPPILKQETAFSSP